MSNIMWIVKSNSAFSEQICAVASIGIVENLAN